jgi:hypothetical protein
LAVWKEQRDKVGTMSMTDDDEPSLKKPEYRRDERGQFARPSGFTLRRAQKKTGIKKQKSRTAENNLPKDGEGVRAGPGRPKGAKGKIPMALKEAILASLAELGGKEYLKTLAIQNSSAYAGLIGKVLPTTLAADESSGGVPVKMVFERHIVYPNGHREIEGVTPKALPAPDASNALPRPTDPTEDTNEGAV